MSARVNVRYSYRRNTQMRKLSQLELGGATFLVMSLPHDPEARRRLTDAERCVLEGVLDGLSDAQIARRRRVSVRTVSKQVASILRKLEVSSRVELGARLVRAG